MQTEASVLDASFPDGKKPQVETIESRLSGFLIGLKDRAYIDPSNGLELAHREFAKYGLCFAYPTLIKPGNYTFPISTYGGRYGQSIAPIGYMHFATCNSADVFKEPDYTKLFVTIKRCDHNEMLYNVKMKIGV